MIMRLDRHIPVRSPRDESSLPGTQMGIALPCLRFAVVLRRANRGRAFGGPAALDGRRACRCTAAARPKNADQPKTDQPKTNQSKTDQSKTDQPK